ncbi:MAG: aggregation factor core [Pseudomonadota bacterium]
MKKLCLTIAALSFSTAAMADVSVVFREGAPKDRFTIENTGGCLLDGAIVTIDLSQSKAGLIFDVTEKGAGVEVFQPFELTSGASYLAEIPTVRDGDNKVSLVLGSLPQSKVISFTIDVDDTVNQREITVSGSEIQGAAVLLNAGGKMSSSTFGTNARATIGDC